MPIPTTPTAPPSAKYVDSHTDRQALASLRLHFYMARIRSAVRALITPDQKGESMDHFIIFMDFEVVSRYRRR